MNAFIYHVVPDIDWELPPKHPSVPSFPLHFIMAIFLWIFVVKSCAAGALMGWPCVPMWRCSFLNCVFTTFKVRIDTSLHSVPVPLSTTPSSSCFAYFGSCRRYPGRLLGLLAKYCITTSWNSNLTLWLPWMSLSKAQAV